MMEYGIKNRAGFIVISGKAILIRHLLNNFAPILSVGLVYKTHREIDNLLVWIILTLGYNYEGMSRVALFDSSNAI